MTGDEFQGMLLRQTDVVQFAVVVDDIMHGNRAIWTGRALKVSKEVADCMEDPDTIEQTLKSLDIRHVPHIDLTHLKLPAA